MVEQDENLRRLNSIIQTIFAERNNRPLLVMYYPDAYGNISDQDVRDVYEELRRPGWSRENQIDGLDVLLHTYGGNPVATYKIAQIIRDFAHNVAFLVPEHAYSAGTLLCLAGNEIRLGDYAGLSPIDITVRVPSSTPEEEIQLLNIDYFIEFTTQCKKYMEQMLREEKLECRSDLESALLEKMVEQVGAMTIGKYFRERTITGHYAQELLDGYMFTNERNKEVLRNGVIARLLMQSPSHDFHMDLHLCRSIRLRVREMSVIESDRTRELADFLTELAIQGVICQDIDEDEKAPFIQLFIPQPYSGGQ